MKTTVAYWIFNYAPKWEAASKEVEFLLAALNGSFDLRLISMNYRGESINLLGKYKYLPLPYCLIGLPLVSRLASNYQINHIFASPAERLLTPRLSLLNSLITIVKETGSDSLSLRMMEKNVGYLKKFKYIVVESERHREILKQIGVEESLVKLIYPGVNKKPYIHASNPFKVCFATSPLAKHDFLSRGLYLMINVAKKLPYVRFVFIWREKYITDLQKLIRNHRINNIDIINGYIADMSKVYDSIHAVILPGLEHNSFKPCPHSALESLAHGKPVLVSRPTSIAELVLQYGCGVVFEPAIESLVKSINHLMKNYNQFQLNCHRTIEDKFSKAVFIDKYKKLYDSMTRN